MEKIKIDTNHLEGFVLQEELSDLAGRVEECHRKLHEKTGAGSEYTGWIDLPEKYDRAEFERIKKTAEIIRRDYDTLVVVGVGGSYLGARAAIKMLRNYSFDRFGEDMPESPQILYMGFNVSPAYTSEIMEMIEDRNVCVNVISKSGTTMESAISFHLIRQFLEKKYGKEESRKRIFVTTDREKGTLRKLSEKEKYETFTVPDDIGGRYSVLTSVGLLPIAAAGIDIDKIMEGAYDAMNDCNNSNIWENDCYKYAAIRNILYRRGKVTEMLVSCEPRLQYFSQWFKQLFAESEGKRGQGILPSSFNFTTDLHSVGQFIQDGRKIIFETAINYKNPIKDIIITGISESTEGLDNLEGKKLSDINRISLEGALQAHFEGGVPSIVINIPENTPYYFGYLAYWFEKACGMSAYMFGVNPFDQPGVEIYKRHVKERLNSAGE